MLTLYRLKPGSQRWFRWLAGTWMTPDMATALGLISSAAAGFAFYVGVLQNRWLLLAVPPLFLVRIVANVLDGVLARETGQAGPRGEVLNEVSDAVGDCLIFVPVALAMPDAVLQALVFSILVVALLGEFTGVAGKLTTGVRRYESLLGGKGDRCVWIGLGAMVLAFAPEAIEYARPYLSLVLGLVVITWVNRLRSLWALL